VLAESSSSEGDVKHTDASGRNAALSAVVHNLEVPKYLQPTRSLELATKKPSNEGMSAAGGGHTISSPLDSWTARRRI